MRVRKNWLMNKPLGFSLLELMVVVAILGILATVAVPRFNIFRARGRQAEAKSNLGVIYTLQESYSVDNESYYNGAAITGGAAAMDARASGQGYRTDNSNSSCVANKLGFTLANCLQTRYAYFVTQGNENAFTAIAYGASDVATVHGRNKRIFPGCNGSGGAKSPPSGFSSTNANFSSGDAWALNESRDLNNYRDIVEYCNQ